MRVKTIFLSFCFLLCSAPAFAQGPLPQWLYEVLVLEDVLFPHGAPKNWYASRRQKEELYTKLCYQQLMEDSSPFVQSVRKEYGARADNQLVSLYALIKARREWLQLETQTGKAFVPYAVAAANPADLSEMSEETFTRLRGVMRLDFDEKTRFADRVERKGTAVFVWFKDWTAKDRVIRLAFEVKEKVLDVCVNDCEEDPFA